MEILCPYCLQKFKRSQALLICRNSANKCKLQTTDAFTDYWELPKNDVSALRPRIYKGGWSLSGAPRLKRCPQCGDDRPDYVCPHCHNSLPHDMVKYGTDIIPIIGGPGVGKTCYMVALIHQLNQYGWRLNMTSALQSLFGEAAEVYVQMSKQMFRDKQVLDKTPVKTGLQNAPWFIRIDNKKKRKKTRPTYLIFYDIAGEQFENANVMRKQAAPIRFASGAIVLLDTMDIPSVRKVLKELGRESSEEYFSIERTVQELFNLSNEDRVLQESPIAFVFSKADVIGEHKASLGSLGTAVDIHQNSIFTRREYTVPGAFRKAEFLSFLNECEQIDAEFRSALSECGIENLYHNNDWDEKNTCFFGISALGQAPETDGSILTERIVPYRVLDPLIWILHKLGKIDIRP